MTHEDHADWDNETAMNHYQMSISDFAGIMEDDLRFEEYKLLWVSAILNARVMGLDSAKEDQMIRALLGLKTYKSPAGLGQFIDLHVENIAAICRNIDELYPSFIQQKYLKQGTEKGIVIGWIENNLRTVGNLIRRTNRLDKSRSIWLDRASVEQQIHREVLGRSSTE